MSVEPKKKRNRTKIKTNEPLQNGPITNEPITNEPITDEPVLNEPVTDEPVLNEPVTNEPVLNEPVTDEPVLNEPVLNEPVLNEPVLNEPVLNEPAIKKRGRKARGAKLISKPEDNSSNSNNAPINIILHLKCCLADLNEYNKELNKMVCDPLLYNPNVPPDITGYTENLTSFATYYEDSCDTGHFSTSLEIGNFGSQPLSGTSDLVPPVASLKLQNIQSESGKNSDKDGSDVKMKEINAKLRELKISLYKNKLNDKKSACFWCSYDFDNVACCIPKYELNDTIFGYGSFCRPECAVAYLFKENIDDSVRFERYYLLNSIYAKIYNYSKNIKPAPDPHYLLEKFYGNLTIQEYRKLLNSQHLLLILEKPMTRVLPEIHDDNDEFTSRTGIYKVKRESEREQGPTKNSIIRDRFGIQ
jgi:hypothetical protein